MAKVTRKADSSKTPVFPVYVLNYLPGAISTAIINEYHFNIISIL